MTADTAEAPASTAKKTQPTKKAAPAKTAAKTTAKPAAKKAAPKSTASTTTASRTATKKTTTKKTTTAKTATETAEPAKSTASKSTAPKAPAAKTAAAKSAAAKTSAAKAASTSAAAKSTAAKTTAVKAAAAKTATKAAATKNTAAKTAAAKTAAAKIAAAKKAEEAKKAADAAKLEDAKRAEEAKQAEEARRAEEAKLAEEVAKAVETAQAEDIAHEQESSTSEEKKPAAKKSGSGKRKQSVAKKAADAAASTAEAVISPAEDPVEELTVVESDTTAVLDASEIEASTELDDIEAAAQAIAGSVTETADPASASDAVVIRGLVKEFGDHRAVDGIDLTVPAGSFYGIVGPNGAGKTTTLSILAGLLRADDGQVVVCGIDQKEDSFGAKRVMGVLPDRLRTFDRLTGRQLLRYYGLLRSLSADVIEKRTADLIRAFDLGDAVGRVVSDYSAGMTKKIMLAGAMIHSPRVLVLDEPFEAVDPVSSAVILDILRAYVAHGGTVILSSHGMDLVERVCSRVAIIVDGEVLAEGTVDEVRAGQTLESRFVELSGGIGEVEGLEWLHTFSD